MSGRPWAVRIGIIAIASAIAIWVIVADTIRRSTTLEPQEIESLLVLLVTGVLLDALVAFRAYRGRVGWPTFIWLGIRALLSIAGLLWITLPSYTIAIVALSRRTTREPSAGSNDEPSRPHAYRSASSGWFGSSMAPFGRTHDLAGARQFAAGSCTVCGAAEDAPIHAPAIEASEA